MATSTPNLGMLKPVVNDPTDEDLWGGIINDDLDILDLEAATKSVNLDFAGFTLGDAEVFDLSETTNDLGSVSGGLTINYKDGHFQLAILTGNITSVTINNLPASGKVGFLSLELTQDGTGGHTISLSSAFRTVQGLGITLSTAASAVDVIRFETRDAGTNINSFINLGLS